MLQMHHDAERRVRSPSTCNWSGLSGRLRNPQRALPHRQVTDFCSNVIPRRSLGGCLNPESSNAKRDPGRRYFTSLEKPFRCPISTITHISIWPSRGH